MARRSGVALVRATLRRFGFEAVKAVASVSSLDLVKRTITTFIFTDIESS